MNLVVITGATRGLGQALTERFAAENWSVLHLSRPQFDFAALDDAETARALDTITGQPKRAVLVLNAARLDICAAREITAAMIKESMDVNLVSPIRIATQFLKRFPNGEIAHISSSATEKPPAFWSLYCAAKSGVDGFLRGLESEGITTYRFDPGVIDTDMQDKIRQSSFPAVEDFISMKASGRLRPADAIAKVVFWKIDRHPTHLNDPTSRVPGHPAEDRLPRT